ncbi:MAG: hypothetical protein C0625_04625 [Arcobacter sp.]|nr:MAG: hypothetical protein C0625_04625 [Arcobacter sp.]
MSLVNFQEALSFFIFGFIELSVLFLAVSFLVEILNTLLNPEKVQRILSSNKSGYFIASGLGSITPFCSCSSIPLTMGLIKAKAGFGPIMTFLFTSPLLNPIVVIVFFMTFGLEVTVIYSIVAFIASLSAGYTLEKLGFEKYIKRDEPIIQSSCCESNTPSFATKPKEAVFSIKKEQTNSCCTPKVNTFSEENSSCNMPIKEDLKSWKEKVFNKSIVLLTWKQFLSFVPYIAIGIGIGAFVHGFVPDTILKEYAGNDNIFAVPFSAIIGIPLYIRASTMVGLGPELIDSGVNMGSILALTVAGAGASLPEMIMLKKIFKLPIMMAFIFAVFTMAIGCGYLVNIYFS